MPLTYQKVTPSRTLKINAQPRSRRCWLQKKMKEMMGIFSEDGDHSEEVVIELLRDLAKKQGMVFAKKSDFQLSVAQSMVLRNHVGTCWDWH